MVTIFISHSSHDRETASAVQRRLVEEGYDRVFLSFDAADGLVGGQEWLPQLSDKLKQARVVLALVSRAFLESRPCRDELAIARHEGKPIIVLRLDDCPLGDPLSRIHLIQHRDDPDTWRRLADALQEAGANPSVFKPHPERPPYPGLLAFDTEDAAMYFGRETEVVDVLARLRRQRQAGRRLLVVAGPSGSGKSSLLRAGIVSRLLRHPEWITTTPVRPGLGIEQGLVQPLADTIRAYGAPAAARSELRAWLDPNTASAESLAERLRTIAGLPNASPVLAIDQGEELLSLRSREEADRMARLFARILSPGSPLLGLLTIRSDMLGALQQQPLLGPLIADDVYNLPPMPRERYALVIDGPIRQYERHVKPGAALQPTLRDELIASAEGADALPLVAFTLGTLWSEYGPPDGTLRAEHLHQLGGVAGAVANVAEAQIAAAQASPHGCDLNALRRAFVPGLASVTSGGAIARRSATESLLPEPAAALLERFVASRLLVRSRDANGAACLEIAHEALLRQWPRLVSWIQDDLESLHSLEALGRATAAWRAARQHPDLHTHRGERLDEASRLLTTELFTSRFEPADQSAIKDYVSACTRAEREIEARTLASEITLAAASFERAQRETDQRRLLNAAALLGAALDANPCARSGDASRQVLDDEDLKRGFALACRTRSAIHELLPRVLFGFERKVDFYMGPDSRLIFHPEEPLLTAISFRSAIDIHLETGDVQPWESGGQVLDWTPEDDVALVALADEISVAKRSSGEILTRVPFETKEASWLGRLIDDGRTAILLSLQACFRLDISSGEVLELTGSLKQQGVSLFYSLTPVGKRHVAIAGAGRLLLIDSRTQHIRLREPDLARRLAINAITFDRHAQKLIYAGVDPTIEIMDSTGPSSTRLGEHEDTVSSLAVLPDERLLLSTGWDGRVALWDLEAHKHLLDLPSDGVMLRSCAAAPRGARLAIADDRKSITVWQRVQQPAVQTLVHGNKITGAAYNPKRPGHLVSCSFVGQVCSAVWTLADSRFEPRELGTRAPFYGLAMSPDGEVFATCGSFPEVRVHSAGGELLQTFLSVGDFADRDSSEPDMRGPADFVRNVTVSHDSRRVAWVAPTGQAWQGDIATGDTERLTLGPDEPVEVVRFSPKEDACITATRDGIVSWHRPGEPARQLLTGATSTSTFGRGNPLAFSRDGSMLAVATEDSRITVLSPSTGEVIHRLEGHLETFKRGWKEAVGALAFAPDGTILVSAGSRQSGGEDPRTIRLWDLATGNQLLRTLTDADCLAAAFDPFSDRLCVATGSRLELIPMPRLLLGSETAKIRQQLEGYLGHEAAGVL